MFWRIGTIEELPMSPGCFPSLQNEKRIFTFHDDGWIWFPALIGPL
jgi:hypothetical protein